jgi:hypothetical protein
MDKLLKYDNGPKNGGGNVNIGLSPDDKDQLIRLSVEIARANNSVPSMTNTARLLMRYAIDQLKKSEQ